MPFATADVGNVDANAARVLGRLILRAVGKREAVERLEEQLASRLRVDRRLIGGEQAETNSAVSGATANQEANGTAVPGSQSSTVLAGTFDP